MQDGNTWEPRYEVERATGIEPVWPAWKAGVLPLNYARVYHANGEDYIV